MVPSPKPGVVGRDLIEHLEVPLRRPYHVGLPFLLVVVASLVAGVVLPKKYRSSTLILVESEKVPDSVVARMTTDSSKQRMATLKQEILSRTRLERVITELDAYPELIRKEKPMTEIIEGMRNSISITVRGNDAFTLDFVHTDPTKTMLVANRLATLFIEENAKSREEQVEGAYEFIESQLQDARGQLEKQEEALRRYKEKRMGTLPEQTGANLATLQRLQLEQQTLAESARAAEDRLRALQEQARTGGSQGSLNPGAEVAQLRSQIAALRSRYTEEHPDVQVLVARLARLESALDTADRTEAKVDPASNPQLSQARGEVASLQAKQADLERRISSFGSRVEQAPRTEQELAVLTRDYQKQKDNYLALLNKKLEAQMAEKLEKRWKGEHFKILDAAHLPERPVFPNRLLLLLLGLAGGLALGLGCAFGAEILDHSVKSSRELEALLHLPLMASISHIDAPAGDAARAHP